MYILLPLSLFLLFILQPSIGGIGRGTLIREIDALGGLIGQIADLSAIQFKVLNLSKGAAVQYFLIYFETNPFFFYKKGPKSPNRSRLIQKKHSRTSFQKHSESRNPL